MDENIQKQVTKNQTPDLSQHHPSAQSLTKKQTNLFIIFGIVILIIIFITAYILSVKNNKSDLQKSTLQGKLVSPTQPPPSLPITVSPIITIGSLVSTANWKTFTDPNYGYSFQYPIDWQLQNSPQKGNTTLPLGILSDNTNYFYNFIIQNSISPKDSPFQVTVTLYNNEKNIPFDHWVQAHSVSYASSQNHIDRQIIVNGYQAIKTNIVPDIKIWGSTLPPFDETFYINSISNNKNIIFAISIVGNGEASSKLYTIDDPFVKKELPVFETFVNSFTFIPSNNFFNSVLSQDDITAIKQSVAQKSGEQLNQLTISIDPATIQYKGLFATGQVGSSTGAGGGAEWYAAKVNGNWVTIAITQAPLPCDEVSKYNLPKSLESTCIDTTNNLITR